MRTVMSKLSALISLSTCGTPDSQYRALTSRTPIIFTHFHEPERISEWKDLG